MVCEPPKLRRILRIWRGMAREQSIANDISERPHSVRSYVPLFKGDTVAPHSLEEITLTAQKLCEEYIERRLRRSGISTRTDADDDDDEMELGTDHNANRPAEYATMLHGLGQILEMRYPKLYSKASAHLNVTFQSEVVVWDVFNRVANSIMEPQVTWARLIALYAFAGGLGVDCVANGKPKLLGRIVSWFGHYVFRHVAFWIQEQGGWEALAVHFKSLGELPDDHNDATYAELIKTTWNDNKDQIVVVVCQVAVIAGVMIVMSVIYTTWLLH